MNKLYTLGSALALGLLTATGVATAADNAGASPDQAARHARHAKHHGDKHVGHARHHGKHARHAKHERFDPVKRTEARLSRLEAKLNLQEAQKAAWQTYADAMLARAKARSERLAQLREQRPAPGAAPDRATRMEKAAELMRKRADELQKVAQDTRALQQVLTPEQQAIFDKQWKGSKRHGRMGHHRPA